MANDFDHQPNIMLKPLTLKFLAAYIAVFILLSLWLYLYPHYVDSPLGIVWAMPYFSIYVFHHIGMPGLLQHDGACGWGWCAPSIFGWGFLGFFWGLIAWLFAWASACIASKVMKTRE